MKNSSHRPTAAHRTLAMLAAVCCMLAAAAALAADAPTAPVPLDAPQGILVVLGMPEGEQLERVRERIHAARA